jgi:hypothetical protein
MNKISMKKNPDLKDPNPPPQADLGSANPTTTPGRSRQRKPVNHHHAGREKEERSAENHPEERSPATESTSLAVNHHHAGKPKPPPNQTVSCFNRKPKEQREREKREQKANEKKREKFSEEMRG